MLSRLTKQTLSALSAFTFASPLPPLTTLTTTHNFTSSSSSSSATTYPPTPMSPTYTTPFNGKNAEFSVVYTSRALNSMSLPFVTVMQELLQTLKTTYNAETAVIIPGSGTYGMEAVARQFVHPSNTGKPLVIRNGFFSFRWTEIFGFINPSECTYELNHTVLMAEPVAEEGSCTLQYSHHDINLIVERILSEKPSVVFMPHVETSIGIILQDSIIKQISDAAHSVGALVCLDCIASGCVWIDMKALGVDILISAPQKGWSGPAGVGLVMLSKLANERMESGPGSSSFSLDLKKWSGMMSNYEKGGFGYHCTMPTDTIRTFNDVAKESVAIGMGLLKERQLELGVKMRSMLEKKGLKSCAVRSCASPGVLVYYSPAGLTNPEIVKKFLESDIQIAAGVPWKLNEAEGLRTFRIGLFGLDKLMDVDGCVAHFEKGVDRVLGSMNE